MQTPSYRSGTVARLFPRESAAPFLKCCLETTLATNRVTTIACLPASLGSRQASLRLQLSLRMLHGVPRVRSTSTATNRVAGKVRLMHTLAWLQVPTRHMDPFLSRLLFQWHDAPALSSRAQSLLASDWLDLALMLARAVDSFPCPSPHTHLFPFD